MFIFKIIFEYMLWAFGKVLVLLLIVELPLPLDNCMATFDHWPCVNFILSQDVSSPVRFIDIEFTPSI